MVRVRPECCPKNSFKKLHARAIGPFRIIRKLGPNAYLLDLPMDTNISPIFNVEDLFPYLGSFEPLILPGISMDGIVTTPTYVPVAPPLLALGMYQIEDVRA